MDLLQEIKDVFKNVEKFQESKNYYFEKHICEETGENKKVLLDFTLANETTDKILRFGYCEGCKTLFYHKDFSSKRF